MENLTFEPATGPAQIRQVARLANDIWHECYARLLPAGQIDYMVENFQSEAAIREQVQKGCEYYLLLWQGQPAGYLALEPEREAGALFLSKIYLLASRRGQGLAEAVFRFSEQRARQLGCSRLWLTVNRGNARALAAYRKNGFSILRSQDVSIGGGYAMEDYVLEKRL